MDPRPLVIDLFCGRGGWTKALLGMGARVIGVDIVKHRGFPEAAEFLQADCLTVDGAQFFGAVLVIASPPCDEFSRFTMPWTRARKPPWPDLGIKLFRAAERIAREAAAPAVIENVRSAERFVGPAVLHIGPFYLWGNGVPVLRPHRVRRKPKEAWGSKQKAERAEIPMDLARHIAGFYL